VGRDGRFDTWLRVGNGEHGPGQQRASCHLKVELEQRLLCLPLGHDSGPIGSFELEALLKLAKGRAAERFSRRMDVAVRAAVGLDPGRRQQ
jgi:hypothetical protein